MSFQINSFSIRYIPHNLQRYNTCGDWYLDETVGELVIKVSETGTPAYNFLIAIHELIEATLCIYQGVSGLEVDEWDFNHPDSDDPGSEEGCPYYSQHMVATTIEHMLAIVLRVSWDDYEEDIQRLSNNYHKQVE